MGSRKRHAILPPASLISGECSLLFRRSWHPTYSSAGLAGIRRSNVQPFMMTKQRGALSCAFPTAQGSGFDVFNNCSSPIFGSLIFPYHTSREPARVHHGFTCHFIANM